MKKLKKLNLALSCTLVLSSCACASTIKASKSVEKLDSLTQKSWDGGFEEVILYPQTTISFNDKETLEANKDAKAKKIKVKALHDDKNLAILIEWSDPTKSVQPRDKTDVYGDGFAVQFALNAKNPAKLPYIGMGSEGRSVLVHLQKAVEKFYEPNGGGDIAAQSSVKNNNVFEADAQKFREKVESAGSGDYQKGFISEGFRGMSEIKDGTDKSQMSMEYIDGKWRGTLVRSLKDANIDLKNKPIAASFAVWDGEKKNRDGMKLLSGWNAVAIGKNSAPLAKALEAASKGDEANGKVLVEQNCASCHQYGDTQMAPNFMAPVLTNIGGYSSAAYLKESIVDPSAVVVPGYNRNAHKNFEWYSSDGKGDGKWGRISTMPPFPLDDKSVEDMVAYLKTLKAEVEK